MIKELFKIIIKTTSMGSVITFLLVALLQIVFKEKHVDKYYVPFYSEILLFLSVWFLSFSLLPIFLNLIKNIRKNFLYSFLSFFGLLIITTLYFTFDETFGFVENNVYFIAVFLPYYAILSYYFVFWRKRQ
jgi:hydrogenase-4 membrane subunit HyfE